MDRHIGKYRIILVLVLLQGSSCYASMKFLGPIQSTSVQKLLSTTKKVLAAHFVSLRKFLENIVQHFFAFVCAPFLVFKTILVMVQLISTRVMIETSIASKNLQWIFRAPLFWLLLPTNHLPLGDIFDYFRKLPVTNAFPFYLASAMSLT